MELFISSNILTKTIAQAKDCSRHRNPQILEVDADGDVAPKYSNPFASL